MTSELCCRPINNQMPNKIFLESRQFWASTPRRRSHCLTDAELLSISTTLRSHNWQVHIGISESASRIWFLYVARFELAHPSKLRIPTLRILPEGFSQLYFLLSHFRPCLPRLVPFPVSHFPEPSIPAFYSCSPRARVLACHACQEMHWKNHLYGPSFLPEFCIQLCPGRIQFGRTALFTHTVCYMPSSSLKSDGSSFVLWCSGTTSRASYPSCTHRALTQNAISNLILLYTLSPPHC